MKKCGSIVVILAAALFIFTGNAYAGWGKNACNPCGKSNKVSNACNPCGAKKNACNPCSKMSKSKSNLVKMGKKLWNDTKLGKSGMSCMTCHVDHENLNLDKIGKFPHYVAMPDKVVTLEQMINFCMIKPMETKALPKGSKKMKALKAYYHEYVKSYKGMKNGCNPCAKKVNACNPCGKKMNACNPCGK